MFTSRVHELGGGSDFGGFIGFAGVSSMDVRYTYNYTLIDYPLYHSAYETYDLFKNHMDPELKVLSMLYLKKKHDRTKQQTSVKYSLNPKENIA